MADDFYARWFSRKVPPQPSKQELWNRHTNWLRTLATSPMAAELVERFDVPEVDEAEQNFKKALEQIADPEIRNAVDMAAGKISTAYQILGFCVGHFSQDSRALQ